MDLKDSDTVALRADTDHVRQMAVLAYTNKMNGFVNNFFFHNLDGKTDTHLEPFDENDVAGLKTIAAYVAFFAPDLSKLGDALDFPYAIFDDDVRVGVNESFAYPGACNLQLLEPIATRDRRSVKLPEPHGTLDYAQALSQLIIDGVLKQSSKKNDSEARSSARAILESVVKAMFNELEHAAKKLKEPTIVYRGMHVPKDMDVETVLETWPLRFVSTSFDRDVADSYTAKFMPNRTKLLFQLEVDAETPAIKVDDELPKAWRCFRTEQELILAPMIKYEPIGKPKPPDKDGVQQVLVHVSPEVDVKPPQRRQRDRV